jgi:hypothetical protein
LVKPGIIAKASPGRWTAGSTLSFQWLRDGQEIPGMIDDTYLITQADSGHELSFRVTATKPGFTDLSVTSQSKIVN